MNKKIIIGIVAAVVVIGGVVGTVLGVNAYQEKKAKEQQRIEQEQAQAVNSLNDKINGIVNALNVPDAEGQNPSLDNNSDIDAINNAIASLQALDAEIDSNTTITEDQKKAIKGIIANYLASLNNRITVVNEEKAKAEAERQQAEAEAQKQASKQTTSNKSKSNNNSGSSSRGSSNSGNSGSSSSGGSAGERADKWTNADAHTADEWAQHNGFSNSAEMQEASRARGMQNYRSADELTSY